MSAQPKKYHRPPANIVYDVDGASYGVDDAIVAAIRDSIRRRLEAKALDLPRLPQVAHRILELSQDPETSLEEIAETISTDAQLATRVLTVANSAAYGGGSRIDNLQQALMRLGSQLVKDMVFAESIRMKVFSARSYRQILEQSWRRSLGTAVACDLLGRETGLERESAFLLGLLHDMGTPVLVSAITDHERQNGGRSLGQDIVEILLSQLHEEVGAYVLTHWGMSEAIVAAARDHHHYRGPDRTPPAAALVFAGNLLCRHLGIGQEAAAVEFTLERVFTDLKLAEPGTSARILASLSEQMERITSGMQAD
jgi:HD-like signal output (HDOD) protein